jgi:hypothetical protein
MSGEYLDWAGHDRYIRLDTSDSIPSFAGLNKLSSLAFSPVNDTDRARLIERGRTFAKYSGVHYMSFVGALNTPGQRPGTWTKTKADGRVMIDKSGFRKMNPSQDIWDAQEDDYDDYSDDYNREQNKTSTSQGAIARSDHVPAELSELSLDLVSQAFLEDVYMVSSDTVAESNFCSTSSSFHLRFLASRWH